MNFVLYFHYNSRIKYQKYLFDLFALSKLIYGVQSKWVWYLDIKYVLFETKLTKQLSNQQ